MRRRTSSRSSLLATFSPAERGRLLEHDQPLGQPLARDAAREHVRAQLLELDACARAELRVQADALAEHRIGHRDGGGERDRRVRRRLGLDGGGADVLAAADDQVRDAPGEPQVAVVADRREVAAQHPAVVRQQLAVGGGVLVVAERSGRAAARNLAGAAARGHVALAVVQPDVHARDRPAGGAEAMLAIVAHARDADRAVLVRAVELQHLGAGRVLEAGGGLGGDGLAAGEDRAQRAEVVAVEQPVAERHQELRRDAREHADALLGDRREHPLDVEALHQDGRRAEQRGHEVRAPQPESVRARHGREEDVAGVELAGVDRQAREAQPAVLVVHHALRQTGRAGGRVQQVQRVGVDRRPRLLDGRRRRGAVDTQPVESVGRDVAEHDRGELLDAVAAQVGEQLLDGRARELLVGEQRRGAGAHEQVRDLAPSRARGDADDRAPGALAGEVGDVDARPVGERDGERRAGPRAGGGEHARERRAVRVVLCPRDRSAIADQRRRVRHSPRVGGDEVAERLAPPLAAPAVSGDLLGRVHVVVRHGLAPRITNQANAW